MDIKIAIEIIEYYQEWRLGKVDEMIYEPREITEALYLILREAKDSVNTPVN